jgi:hypothetical protein
MIGSDTSGFFYPMSSFHRDRPLAFDVQGWNPHQFNGAPFAGDFKCGWMNLNAMLPFSSKPRRPGCVEG